MSILSDDGLLPITVLCEVMDETLDIRMGYRGFSYMEVGIRAVGRVRRCDIVEGRSSVDNSDSNSDGELIRRTTALDDIHHGKFVDWLDDPLDEEEKITANEYRENILSILRLGQEQGEEDEQAERLRCQQRSYESACEIVALNNSSNEGDEEGFIAASWGALAAARTAADNGSINIDALTTTNTVERLRLGLAMLLENQIPFGRSSTIGGGIRKSDGVDEDKNLSAIEPDETDAFQ